MTQRAVARKPACEALPGRVAGRVGGDRSGRASYSGQAVVPGRRCLPQLIGLISGVMTGVTAGAMGFMGAAGAIAGLAALLPPRAAFLLAGFFAALRASVASRSRSCATSSASRCSRSTTDTR